MSKEYLVRSSYYGYYSLGFVCIEIINEETMQQLNKLKKDNWSFYVHEWEGKHSEMYVELEDNDFVVISEDQEYIEYFRKLFGDYVGNIHYSDYVLERYYESEDYYEENE